MTCFVDKVITPLQSTSLLHYFNSQLEVRAAALEGIRDSLSDLPTTEVYELYIDAVQSNLRVLAKSIVFHGRQSAATLIGILFCHVYEQSKVERKEILVNVIISSLGHIKTVNL